MEVTAKDIEEIMSAFHRRVELIRMVGGIAFVDVMNGRDIPAGYVLDSATDFFMPAGFEPNTSPQ